MKLIETIRDKAVGALAGGQMGGAAMSRSIEESENRFVKAQESLVGLELAMEDVDWRNIGGESGLWNFNRAFLKRLVALSRIMYLVNPLIRRAVTVQELYVWGSSCTIKAEDDIVDEVLNDFFEDPKNQQVIGQNWPEREREQRIDGNTFFVFYLNRVNGTSRVRLLPFDQIEDVVCNPDDAKEPWYYKRTGAYSAQSSVGLIDDSPANVNTLYPDINYNPKSKPAKSKDGVSIDWNTRVLHVKTGGLSQMKFGIPELYSTLNWATAYKRILENFATILAAYARMAMKMTGLAGKKGVAAAKSKMGTGISSDSLIDRNPPTNVASWMMMSGNTDIAPIKTANSTTGPDEARALRSMVAAGSDTPEHFFGDSDIGNFATSSTLDRPTELKMVARQKMWMFIILQMASKLIEWSASAPQGKLRQAGYKAKKVSDLFDGTQLVIITPPADGSLEVTVTFPSILERDVTDRVRSVVQAATLGGSPAEGIIPDRKYLFKLLLIALGEKDADKLVDKYYPKSVTQGFADPADRVTDEHLAAQGKADIGDAALQQAAAAKTAANKPTPKPSGSPSPAVSNK